MQDVKKFIKESREVRRAHLQLEEPCCERGGNSTNHKGVLAQYLNTTIPSGRILLCHACHNGKCSNPKHLYWGTDYDNLTIDRAEQPGGSKSPWERAVDKYGYEEACKMSSIRMKHNSHGSGNRGRPKSEDHKKKIAEAVKNQKNRGKGGGRKPIMSYADTIRIWQEFGITDGAKYLGLTQEAFKCRVRLAKKKLTLTDLVV